MAKKRVPNGVDTPIKTAPADPPLSISTDLASDPLPSVRINKAHLGEIKSALDDVVKEQLRGQAFTPSLLHPTVHLALGYTSILLSLGSCLYAFRMPFEDSKPTLWIGVIGYTAFQTALWAWKRWVEKGEVFRGKRRRMVKRIETDHIQILSSTTLSPPPQPVLTFSPHTRPSSPSSPSSVSPATLSPSSSSSALHSHPRELPTSISSSSSSSSTGPSYVLQVTLSTTSNNGKSLLKKARVVSGRCVGEFVDDEGGVEEGEVRRWIGGLLGEAGLVGAEEEGAKEE